jgi:hypothetical protein
MQDAIDALGAPDVLTLEQVASRATASSGEYLRDRKNARRVPHRLEACGYVVVRNDAATDGLWKVALVATKPFTAKPSYRFTRDPYSLLPTRAPFVDGHEANIPKEKGFYG